MGTSTQGSLNWLLPGEGSLSTTNRVNGPSSSQISYESSLFPHVGDRVHVFTLIEEFAAGAFSRVYLARQECLANRVVVLKASTTVAGEPQKLARLTHPNIVTIHSVHSYGSLELVCMPYLGRVTLQSLLGKLPLRSGHDLANAVADFPHDHLATEPGNDLEKLRGMTFIDAVLHWGAGLAAGLAHAHRRGILHRDLKPANVLITHDGVPMILDFNVSSECGSDDGRIGGTVMYMAPEHLRAYLGEDILVDERSDVYSLGLLLYQMLAGVLPLSTASHHHGEERLRAVLAERLQPLPPPSTFHRKLPRAMDAIVMRALEPDPARRYQSADELRNDLERQLKHQPLAHVPEVSLTERAAKWRRRHPALAAAMIGFLLLGTVLGSMVAERRARQRAEGMLVARQSIEHLQDAVLRLTAQSEPIGDGYEAATRTLAHYGVSQDPHWRERPAFARLDPPLRKELDDAISEAVVVLAQGDHADVWKPMAASMEPRSDYFRGLELAAADRPAEALAYLKNSTNYRAWFARGVCHDRLNQPADAAEAFAVCVALRPDHAAAWFNRGLARLKQRRFSDAIADFTASLERNPDHRASRINRGLAYEGLKHWRDACDEYTAMLTDATAPSRVYFLRSRVLSALGDKTAAVADKAQGFARTPNDAAGFATRARWRQDAGDIDAAISDYREAIRKHPNHRDAQLNLAIVLADYRQKNADAISLLDAILDRNPGDHEARGGRAVYLARLGKDTTAKADATAVLAADHSAFRLYQMAGVYALISPRETTAKAKALDLLRQAIQAGFQDWATMKADTDLDALRHDAAFQSLLANR